VGSKYRHNFLVTLDFRRWSSSGRIAGRGCSTAGWGGARVSRAGVYQTPSVHTVPPLAQTDPVFALAAPDCPHPAADTGYASGSRRNSGGLAGGAGEAPATASDEYHRLDGGAAIAFERELGDRLFHDPGALVAARRTAERLFDVMRLLHTRWRPGTTPKRTERTFFNDKLTNPGQVGRGVVTLPELLREGNLRMVMTSLLNATHDSKDPMTVETTIQELLKQPRWEEVADRAGLDVRRLRALKDLVDAGHGVFAVPALGSHSLDARDAVTECVASRAARWRRPLADRAAYRWTAREFADRGIALHPLEVAAQRRAESAQPVPDATQIVRPVAETRPRDVLVAAPAAQDWSQQIDSAGRGTKPAALSQHIDDPDTALHWVSGRALFGMDTEASWFRVVSVERGFPVTTGISGCAARLHSVFVWIRPEGVSEHEFARALIGWMLPSDHHSLYEVIRGIQVASPHLFHWRDDGFAHVGDLYRRAPRVSSHGEEEHGDSAPAPAPGLTANSCGSTRRGVRGQRSVALSTTSHSASHSLKSSTCHF
jgi:hypothetical protein